MRRRMRSTVFSLGFFLTFAETVIYETIVTYPAMYVEAASVPGGLADATFAVWLHAHGRLVGARPYTSSTIVREINAASILYVVGNWFYCQPTSGPVRSLGQRGMDGRTDGVAGVRGGAERWRVTRQRPFHSRHSTAANVRVISSRRLQLLLLLLLLMARRHYAHTIQLGGRLLVGDRPSADKCLLNSTDGRRRRLPRLVLHLFEKLAAAAAGLPPFVRRRILTGGNYGAAITVNKATVDRVNGFGYCCVP